MSYTLNFPFDNIANYTFDSGKIELVSSKASLTYTTFLPQADLHVKLDDGTGTVAGDSSGNDRHGTLSGGYGEAQWVPGKINTAITGINGSSGYINFGNINGFSVTTAFTIEFWLKMTTTELQYLVSKKSAPTPSIGYVVATNGGYIRFAVTSSLNESIVLEHNTAVNDGSWHHVVAVYGGTRESGDCFVYVDNSEDSIVLTDDTLTGTIQVPDIFQISGRNGNTYTFQSGTTIDEVVVYQRSLTEEEVAFRWNSGDGTQDLPGEVVTYDTSNPAIALNEPLNIKELISFSATVDSFTGDDTIKYSIVDNGTDKWHNGSAWVDSSGFSESNTLIEIQNNLSTLLTSPSLLNFKIHLHSGDGSTTPRIDAFSIVFNPAGSTPLSPGECLVYGYIYNNQGDAVENVSITARLLNTPVYDSTIQMTRNEYTTLTDSNGYWEMSLVENANMEDGAGYKFCFNGDNIKYTANRAVPAEIARNFTELTEL